LANHASALAVIASSSVGFPELACQPANGSTLDSPNALLPSVPCRTGYACLPSQSRKQPVSASASGAMAAAHFRASGSSQVAVS
jgi:hypothetical protein